MRLNICRTSKLSFSILANGKAIPRCWASICSSVTVGLSFGGWVYGRHEVTGIAPFSSQKLTVSKNSGSLIYL
ncbi:hypothetical protein ACU8KH_00323 [Lachancea thermotolerans]